jgi:hypothetical protein
MTDEILSESVVYLSTYDSYTIKLKPTRTVFVDGTPIKQPGIYAEFRDGVYRTQNPDIVKRMDALLNGPNSHKYVRMFRKQPDRKTFERAQRMVAKIEEEKNRAIASVKTDGSEKTLSDFDEFLKKRQTAQDAKDKVKTQKGVIGI